MDTILAWVVSTEAGQSKVIQANLIYFFHILKVSIKKSELMLRVGKKKKKVW